MNENIKKKKFKLRLKGYRYKGIIDDWYYELDTAWGLYGLPLKGNAQKLFGTEEICIPPQLIESKERIDGKVMIFLIDGGCFELGTERDE